jgi:hypothetical protein
MKTYLVKIFLEKLKFEIPIELEQNFTQEVFKQKVLDFMGKISKEQLEKYITSKNVISNFFYITYEEVERDIIVPITSGQENKLGVAVEQVIS